MTSDFWRVPTARFPNGFMPRNPTCNRMEWNSSALPMRQFPRAILPSDNQRPPWNRNFRAIRSSDNPNWRSGPHWNEWNVYNSNPSNLYGFQPPPRYQGSTYPGSRFRESSYHKQLPFINSGTSSSDSNYS